MPHVHDGGEGNTAPLVSFLTTAYRTEQYVSETIESVLAQTRGDWQLIVVDNGNSDEMARIVGNYTSDPRITLIRQENRGYLGGVSTAAAVADGRYLCVLDSDDAVEPNYCARIGALTEDDPRIDAVGCNAVPFWDPDADDAQKPREYFATSGRKTAPDPSRSASFTELLDEGVPPYVGAIRREAWDALGGYGSSADVEPDVVLWLRLAGTGRDVRILPDKLVRTRVRPDSSSKDPANIEAFAERMQRAYILAAQEHGVSESAVATAGMLRRLRYIHSLRRARSALLTGDVHAARTAARDAFRQRRTVRAAVALGGLRLSPGLLAAIHPAKNRVENALRRARFRMSRKRQVKDPTRPESAGPRAPLEAQP
jgi:glycosyltransferase involved in cell wall biosynthesis